MLVISVFNLEPSLRILGSISSVWRHSRCLLTLSTHVYTALCMFASVHRYRCFSSRSSLHAFFLRSFPSPERLKLYSIEPIFFGCAVSSKSGHVSRGRKGRGRLLLNDIFVPAAFRTVFSY